jgi:hypothetical protein
MYNRAGTINKTTTIGTTNMSEQYYLDPTRPTVISTAIYNTSTTNNNFSNTDESGIMYINAGQETNFRTTRLLQKSPFNGITRYSEFDANSVNDYFYVDSANLDRQKATVTVERGDTIDAVYNNGIYTIETGSINLKAKKAITIDSPITPTYSVSSNLAAIGGTRGYQFLGPEATITGTGRVALHGNSDIPAGIYILSLKFDMYSNNATGSFRCNIEVSGAPSSTGHEIGTFSSRAIGDFLVFTTISLFLDSAVTIKSWANITVISGSYNLKGDYFRGFITRIG